MITSARTRSNLIVLIVALILMFLPPGEPLCCRTAIFFRPIPLLLYRCRETPPAGDLAPPPPPPPPPFMPASSDRWLGNAYVNPANYIPADDVDQHIINQAYTEITKNYVFTNAIDKQKMAFTAINAMVDTLGDTGHSRFETPEEYKNEAGQLNNDKILGSASTSEMAAAAAGSASPRCRGQLSCRGRAGVA